MKKKYLLILSVTALSALTMSCGGNSGKQAGGQTSEASAAEDNLLADPAALDKAEAALRALPKFSGKKIRIFQNGLFYKGGDITLSIQDPDKPENIDEYKYSNGLWKNPEPVQISGDGNMDDNLWSLDKIKFSTVAAIYKNWNEKAKTVEGATKELTSVTILFWVPTQELSWSTSYIEGTREKYDIDFNLDGSVKKFEKH